jgi:hypothetical protein
LAESVPQHQPGLSVIGHVRPHFDGSEIDAGKVRQTVRDFLRLGAKEISLYNYGLVTEDQLRNMASAAMAG